MSRPLGSAEPIEDVDLQQLVDDFAAGVADLGRLAAAPDRRPHLKGDLLWRIVALVDAFSLVKGCMGLDELAVVEDLDHRGGRADVDAAADQLPRNRVEGAADLDVDVRTDRGRRPAGQHERSRRQRQQFGRLQRVEHGHRGGPAQRPALPPRGDLLAPGHGLGLHVLDGGELPPRQNESRT